MKERLGLSHSGRKVSQGGMINAPIKGMVRSKGLFFLEFQGQSPTGTGSEIRSGVPRFGKKLSRGTKVTIEITKQK